MAALARAPRHTGMPLCTGSKPSNDPSPFRANVLSGRWVGLWRAVPPAILSSAGAAGWAWPGPWRPSCRHACMCFVPWPSSMVRRLFLESHAFGVVSASAAPTEKKFQCFCVAYALFNQSKEILFFLRRDKIYRLKKIRHKCIIEIR